MNRSFSLLATLGLTLLLFPVQNSLAEGRLVLDWSNAPAGEAPPKEMENMKIITKGTTSLKVLDAKTTPPSPMPEGRACVQTDAEGEDSRIAIGTALGAAPLKGWVEVELILAPGKNTVIDLMQGFAPDKPSGNTVARVFVRSNDATMIMQSNDREKKVALMPKVTEGAPTKVRMGWDFTGEPTITLAIDGQPGATTKGEATGLILTNADKTTGIDYVRVNPVAGYVGNVWCSE